MTHGRRGRSRSAAVAACLTLGLVAASLGACGSAAVPSAGAGTTAPAAGEGQVSSPVVGVPISIEAEGFSKVKAFTIRTDAGEELRFLMGTLENGAEFPPNHLAEHLSGSTRVRVFFRLDGADRVAYRLEDATTP